MMRKATVITLSLLSIAALTVGIMSFISPKDYPGGPSSGNRLGYSRGVLQIEINREYQNPSDCHPFIQRPAKRFVIPGVFHYRVNQCICLTPFLGRWDVLIGSPHVVGHIHTFRLQLWFVVVLCSPYPAVAFIRGPFRRSRRRKKGLCLKCGYNLTGNVSGICPECGERIGSAD